jgi:3-hydroxymyristoyl/3-hydroxydecanoyl-(acyl carrier protein) dehydratase
VPVAQVVDALSTSLIDIDETFLPIGRLRQITRVTALSGSEIAGLLEVGSTHWVFLEHFPGDPVFPGTLLIEAAGQLVALWAWAEGQRGRPRLVRAGAQFHGPVGPEVFSLCLRASVRRKRHLNFASIEITAGDTRVATLDAVLAVLAPG